MNFSVRYWPVSCILSEYRSDTLENVFMSNRYELLSISIVHDNAVNAAQIAFLLDCVWDARIKHLKKYSDQAILTQSYKR